MAAPHHLEPGAAKDDQVAHLKHTPNGWSVISTVSRDQEPAELCAGQDALANQNNITITEDEKQKAVFEHIHKRNTNPADKHILPEELAVNSHMKNGVADHLHSAQSHPKHTISKDVTSIFGRVIENRNGDTLMNVKATINDNKIIPEPLTNNQLVGMIVSLLIKA